MKTLYKNSSRLAAAILGSLVFSTGVAVALTRDPAPAAAAPEPETVGRFVVTPQGARFEAPENVGRFVVSQRRAEFIAAPVALA